MATGMSPFYRALSSIRKRLTGGFVSPKKRPAGEAFGSDNNRNDNGCEEIPSSLTFTESGKVSRRKLEESFQVTKTKSLVLEVTLPDGSPAEETTVKPAPFPQKESYTSLPLLANINSVDLEWSSPSKREKRHPLPFAIGDLVWVTEGKTEHLATLVGSNLLDDDDEVMVKWTSNNLKEYVPVSSVKALGKEKRRRQSKAGSDGRKSLIKKRKLVVPTNDNEKSSQEEQSETSCKKRVNSGVSKSDHNLPSRKRNNIAVDSWNQGRSSKRHCGAIINNH